MRGISGVPASSSHFPRGPVRLDDCTLHGPASAAELFVVEGESAAAAVSRVRDAAFQAVLPMRGKPLNAAKAPESRVRSHPLFIALAAAVGTGIGDHCDPAHLRYGRILLLMDPDADGIHCGVLMLLFLHRWMRPLLDAGRVAVVRPPWGEVVGAGEPGPRHAFSEPEFAALAARLAARGPAVARRYRGLAGIDPAVLGVTCVAPATRRVERATTADVEAMIAVLGGGA
jgi:DNA gyrase subunit B/topoisomerase-4 subunit B